VVGTEQRRGEGQPGDEREIREQKSDRRRAQCTEIPEEPVIREPVVPEHGEPDEERDEFGLLVVERPEELRAARGVLQRGDGDGDDQQGHRDREDGIGEERGALEFETLAVAPPADTRRTPSRRRADAHGCTPAATRAATRSANARSTGSPVNSSRTYIGPMSV